MFTLKYINKYALAEYLDRDITVNFISDIVMFVGMNPKRGEEPVCSEIDAIEGNGSYNDTILITVTSERLYASGTLSHTLLNNTVDYLEGQLCDMRVRTYLQTEAHNAVVRYLGYADHKELFKLSESLRQVPEGLVGYYDTLGERAFFALVEQGHLKEEDAYRYLYDI